MSYCIALAIAAFIIGSPLLLLLFLYCWDHYHHYSLNEEELADIDAEAQCWDEYAQRRKSS